MFIRYLGGGIGHLEQFPPANNDDEDMTPHEDINEGAEDIDNGDGSSCVEGDEDVDDDMEEDEDLEVDDDSDQGESSDEEVGNVY